MSWINEFEDSGKNLLQGLLFYPLLQIVKNREEDRFWFLKRKKKLLGMKNCYR